MQNKTIKIKTPAKINLTLEILNKREDDFHNIQSIMQTVDLYDYLTIAIDNVINANMIELSGNSNLIPYDNKNLIYKATELFLNETKIKNQKIQIYLEKNIPVAAGLAGGSSNAAGTLFGLNEIFNKPLTNEQLLNLAAQLGSDLNFCLIGGTQLATSRGEILEKITTPELNIVIIKPKNTFISAKEAYVNYANLENKPAEKNLETMIKAIETNNTHKIAELLNNELELGILCNYSNVLELKNTLKTFCLNAIMSGSGPSVFGIYESPININIDKDSFDIFFVKSINSGVQIV